MSIIGVGDDRGSTTVIDDVDVDICGRIGVETAAGVHIVET